MINRAIEQSPGGFAAVHAKLRTKVLDLTTFIGSLAVSVDPATGKRVKEVELQLSPQESKFHPSWGGVAPMLTSEVAKTTCEGGFNVDGSIHKHLLIVAGAGSGKTVFSRALVRHAVNVVKRSESSGLCEESKPLLPVRIPLSELARIVYELRNRTKVQARKLDKDFDKAIRNFTGDLEQLDEMKL